MFVDFLGLKRPSKLTPFPTVFRTQTETRTRGRIDFGFRVTLAAHVISWKRAIRPPERGLVPAV